MSKSKTPLDDPPLLYRREQVSRLLNVSVALVVRLEQAGVLTPVKLDKSKPNSLTLYSRSQVHALARVDEL